jgi:hypothetical protein
VPVTEQEFLKDLAFAGILFLILLFFLLAAAGGDAPATDEDDSSGGAGVLGLCVILGLIACAIPGKRGHLSVTPGQAAGAIFIGAAAGAITAGLAALVFSFLTPVQN